MPRVAWGTNPDGTLLVPLGCLDETSRCGSVENSGFLAWPECKGKPLRQLLPISVGSAEQRWADNLNCNRAPYSVPRAS